MLIAIILCQAFLGCVFAETSIATLAARKDTVKAWKAVSSQAAEALMGALYESEVTSREVTRIDLDSLKIWHGQQLEIVLEAGNVEYRYQTSPVQSISRFGWHSLVDVIPRSQGGVKREGDTHELEHAWLLPVQNGAQLAEFSLEGPLDIFMKPKQPIQLWLPHSADVSAVERIILRQGVSIKVQGASSIALRKPLHLPSISLGEFVNIVQTDGDYEGAEGLMKLAEGLRQRASGRITNGTSPVTVSLMVECSELGAMKIAATETKLRVKLLKEGVYEISNALEETNAVSLSTKKYMWPLKSAKQNQTSLSEYEYLLREILSSAIFTPALEKDSPHHPVGDVPLKLAFSSATALMLLQLDIDIDKVLSTLPEGALGSGTTDDSRPPPNQDELLLFGMKRKPGVREKWRAIMKVEGNVQQGLKYTPLRVELLEGGKESVVYDPGTLLSHLMGGNFTSEAHYDDAPSI